MQSQRGLFGADYSVDPDCDSCGGIAKNGGHAVNMGGECKTLCDDCFEAEAYNFCEDCEEYTDEDVRETCPQWDSHARRMVSRVVCETCLDNNYTRCEGCSEYANDDEVLHTYYGSNICHGCYDDSYATCEECNEIFAYEDLHSNDYGYYCNNCRQYGENFDPHSFRNRSGRITEIGSARCYGIELETDKCDGYEVLADRSAWGAKDDFTVDGKEFYSAILDGDEGLEAILVWADIARRNCWHAGMSAGYHLHLDMRNEDDDSLYAIAYAYAATGEIWHSFVDERRHNYSYCSALQFGCSDVVGYVRRGVSFDNFARAYNSRRWLSIYAYHCHETFEVRLHQGTCDEDEIINWVKAHTRFADWAATKGLDGLREIIEGKSADEIFEIIAREAWQDDSLRAYYLEKAADYNHGYISEKLIYEDCAV